MSKITNTKNMSSMEKLVTALPGGRGIEMQEKAGQRELVNAAVLPRKGLTSENPKTWEAMGVKIGAFVDGDDLFVNVTLPPGWSKKATDHSMWTNLVDDKGRVRATMFYKAAFYDRDAFIRLERRFDVRRNYDRPDYRTMLQVVVKDRGKVIFETAPIAKPASYEDSEKIELAMHEECVSWLTEKGFPDWGNASAYWD